MARYDPLPRLVSSLAFTVMSEARWGWGQPGRRTTNTLRAPAWTYPSQTWASQEYGSQVPCSVAVPSGAAAWMGELNSPRTPTTVAMTTAIAATTKVARPRRETRLVVRPAATGGVVMCGSTVADPP